MPTLADAMTRDQRFAYRRMTMAAQVLADPDATLRERRSAQVSFYRGFRALARAYGFPADLAGATMKLGAFTERMIQGDRKG